MHIICLWIFVLVVANEDTLQEFLKPHTPIAEETNDKTLVDNNKKKEKNVKRSFAQSKLADDSAVPISQVSTLNDKLFEGNLKHMCNK